jgi:hypothetical protein
MIGQGVENSLLLRRIFHRRCFAQDDHGPIVHGMMKCGTRKHQAVEQGDGDADGGALSQSPQRPAGRRTVKIKSLTKPNMNSRDHEGLPVSNEADVTDKGLVQYCVD